MSTRIRGAASTTWSCCLVVALIAGLFFWAAGDALGWLGRWLFRAAGNVALQGERDA